MNYQEYLDMRGKLMNELQELVNSGASDEDYNAKKAEVEALDKKWDATAARQADLNALSDDQRVVNIQNAKGVDAEGATATAKVSFADKANMSTDEKEALASDEYVNAWAKMMMGKQLTVAESAAIAMVNDYTHTTINTGVVIPETVASGIWDMVEEMYPLWADAQKTYVKGNYTVPISDTSSDAAWYDEATATADGVETFRELALSGCELSRSITISWKLREMAVADFVPFIQKKLAQKMGAALGYGVAQGKGQPGQSDTFKPEPKGIITALEAEENTPQIVEYDATYGIVYADLTEARSLIKVGANNLAWYANSATIWGSLANVLDNNQRPLMIADPAAGGITRIFGIPVKEDDSIPDEEVLLAAPGVGYIANVNKEMSIQPEEHVKARTVDYCAYAIVDGGVLSTKAFALLKKGTANQGE